MVPEGGVFVFVWVGGWVDCGFSGVAFALIGANALAVHIHCFGPPSESPSAEGASRGAQGRQGRAAGLGREIEAALAELLAAMAAGRRPAGPGGAAAARE